MSLTYYRYSLINTTSGTLVLTEAPQEWASDQSFWERSMIYWGVFRSFSTKELSFIRAGAQFLKTIFDREGTEAICDYKVEALNTSTYLYSTIYQGLIDFSTYKYIPGSSQSFDVVKVQVIDNDFINRIKTRESLPVNLAKLTDIDGDAITSFTNEGKMILVPQRTDTYTAIFEGGFAVGPVTESDIVAIPIVYTQREDESIYNVETDADPTAIEGAFFRPAYATTLNVHIELDGTTSSVIHVYLTQYRAGVVFYEEDISISPPTISVDDTFTFDCYENDYVVLKLSYNLAGGSIGLNVNMTTTNNKIVFTNHLFKGWFYHEAFTRILQSITGEASPFYSDLLGRTDSEIDTYAADGAMSLGVVTNGLLLRGFDIGDADVAFAASLKELFLSLHSIYPLSLGIETISGTTKIRIEELRHVFNDTVFLTIEGATEISEEVANDLTYSALNHGFSKSEEAYNKIKGRFEYNSKVSYSTPLTRQQNEFSQIAPYRSDTNGIVNCIIKSKTSNATEDTDFDNDNFLINIVRDTVLQVARREGFDTITGVDNEDHAYNLNYHPARNIKRWGSFLRGCLFHQTDKILSFLKSTKNSGITTKKTDESFTISEGTDIDIDTLNVEFFENIYYSFNLIVTNQVLDMIGGTSAGLPNIYKLIRFRNNKSEAFRYGWLMRFESRKPDDKGMGSMKLLKARLAIVIVTTGTEITIIVVGTGVIVVDWGDGTTETVTLTGGSDSITHTYTDGASDHNISIVGGENITSIDLTGQNVTDITVPPVFLYDETDNPDGNITEITLTDNSIPDVDPDAVWPDNVIIDYHGTPISTCEVIIGRQIWMCRDWFVDFPGSKVYDDDEDNRAVYGGLYTYEMIKSADFCPVGWHVPTYQEWMELIEFCGGASVAGGVLKQTGTTVWDSPNEGAVDTYSFKARGHGNAVISVTTGLPVYSDLKSRGSLWLLYPEYPEYQWYVDINKDSAAVVIAAQPYTYLRGVRLIKNTPYVETITDYDGNVYHVAYIGIQKWLIENLKVTHYNDGTAIPEITDGDDWKNAVAPATFDDWFLPSLPELDKMRTELHAYGLGGFTNDKYWCAFDALSTSGHAIDFTDGTEWTAPKNYTYRVRAMRRFTTTDIYALRDTGPAGGLICHIVNLGGGSYQYYEASPVDLSAAKLWSNITTGVSSSGGNIGDGPGVTALIIAQSGHTDSAAKLCADYSISIGVDGAFCWHNNNIANKTPYGALYNWHAVNNVKGLAPTGCRVATKADWDTLVAFLVGFNPGGLLKESGIEHWLYPNEGALDKYGFAAVGASSRSGSTGNFGVLKQTTYFWTSTEHDTSDAEYSALTYINGYIGQSNMDKKYGISVRCIVE